MIYRTDQSRIGQNLESSTTLDEAARYNKPVCAEELWLTIKENKDEIKRMQCDEALVTAAEHNSLDVIKVQIVKIQMVI